MARTGLVRMFRELHWLHRRASESGRTIEEERDIAAARAASKALRGEGEGGGVSRRRFVGGIATAAAGAAVLSAGRSVWATQPRIAIVGSGIAGLTAAVELADAGFGATIYDASTGTVGGRMQSDRGSAQAPLSEAACSVCHGARTAGDDGLWVDGQVTDIFGEMIDTGHTKMLALADRFGLDVVDMLAAQPAGSTDTYHFFGSYYSKAECDADFAALFPAIRRDLNDAGYPTTYERSRPAGRVLDSMSIYDWIESRVPGGHTNPLGSLIDIAYAIEFGADTTDQSALSMLYLLGYSSSRQFEVFGTSDERFRLADGANALPSAMADFLGGEDVVQKGHWLEAIELAPDGSYRLYFDVDGGRHTQVSADIVILAIPFAVLRDIDYVDAGFDDRKDLAIQELGRGKNGKLQLQFERRYWAGAGPWGIGNGMAYSDTGFQNTWEPTRGFPGTSGVLLKYTGGSAVDLLRQNHPYGNSTNPQVLADARQFLAELEPVYPGVSDYWNGRAAGSMAHLNPRFGCSYSYWRVGQYQTFAGYESVPQGNVFFAGEHCSLDFQGWMEGAARSGSSAAAAVASRIRRRR